MTQRFELAETDLRGICDTSEFQFKDTSEISPLENVIGQERAVKAIDFGLNMKSPGYNIFVTGLSGTGKSTIVQDIVTKFAKTEPTPVDWCMVDNFKDAFRPRSISVPAGKGKTLSKSLDRVIEEIKKDLPKAFSDEAFLQRQSRLNNRYGDEKAQIFKNLEKFAAQKNLRISKGASGYQTVPVLDDKPLTAEDFRNLSEEKQREIEDNMRQIRSETDRVVREIQKLDQAMQEEIEHLMEQTAMAVVKDRLEPLKDQFHENRDVVKYLYEVQATIVENVRDFIEASEGGENKTPPFQQPKNPFLKYKVNVLVDRKGKEGAPVVFETNPSYQNLFGQIEKRAWMGTLMTDFTMIKAGSLLEASGGYLIMEIESVLQNPSYVWEALKRALQNKRLYIEDIATSLGFGTASLRPEPIPLDVKVILLGAYYPFQLLQTYDAKFNKIFRVRADFDSEVVRNKCTIQQYAHFIARACKAEGLLPFTPDGVAAIEEFGKKYVSNKNKLSLRFGAIMGILKEADFWARRDRESRITEAYVVKAFAEYRFRYNLYEEKIHESIADDSIMIDVDGAVVGQVNALAVYQVGDLAFGRPARITAETYMGRKGIINIEREAKLSGKTHDKGVLILSGFLGRTFAQHFPLNVSISITFEQNYGGVDGDSASSTELYAILSSLSGIPIQQGLAVTGSVNQKGEVQAIGGVNQKIEGFFDVCKTKGLTGGQGVIIPSANVKNLMLKREVVEAVAQGRFHVYQISKIADGIELLTGVPAGEPDPDGLYPEKTVFGEAQKKLKTYWERAQKLKKMLDQDE